MDSFEEENAHFIGISDDEEKPTSTTNINGSDSNCTMIDNAKYANRSALFKLLFDGGTLFDAFLMEAAQQIGQSLLTIPWIFSLMGYAGAIISLLIFSVLAMWSNHLVISLLTQFRYELNREGDPRASTPGYIASYGDVIGWFCGKKFSIFTHIVVILSLVGTSVGQIIATASNLFLLQDPENYAFSKRTITCIIGGIFSLECHTLPRILRNGSKKTRDMGRDPLSAQSKI